MSAAAHLLIEELLARGAEPIVRNGKLSVKAKDREAIADLTPRIKELADHVILALGHWPAGLRMEIDSPVLGARVFLAADDDLPLDAPAGMVAFRAAELRSVFGVAEGEDRAAMLASLFEVKRQFPGAAVTGLRSTKQGGAS